MQNLLIPLSDAGNIVRDLPPVQTLRANVLEQLRRGRWMLERGEQHS